MSFTSNLSGSLIIDDSNFKLFADEAAAANDGMGTGYAQRDYAVAPLGTYADESTKPIIPRSDWEDIIREKTERKANLFELFKFRKMPILNQRQRPYCWAYGTVGAMMLSYAKTGPYVPHLSATSVAAKVKNYRDVGGWAGEALDGIRKYGVSTLEYWPEAQLDRRFDTPEQRNNASLHKHIEFAELPSRSFESLATALLSDDATTLGLTWWGHLVYAFELVVIERGRFGVRGANSWDYSWGDNGLFVLDEARAIAHEQISVLSATPTRPVNG
jgi:hypothetical protein